MDNQELQSLIKEPKILIILWIKNFILMIIFLNLILKNIFSKQWVFVGHTSRIPSVGDYFLFEIGKESIIIIRDKNSNVYAHFNVCRHRGSRVCLEGQGNTKLLVCPYHAWSYNLDGSIKSARLMNDDFNPDEWTIK